MTNDERSPNDEMPKTLHSEINVESAPDSVRALEFVIHSSLVNHVRSETGAVEIDD